MNDSNRAGASRTTRFSLPVLLLLLLPLAGLLVGCGNDPADDGEFRVVATTGHIHDALLAITAGTHAKLKLLCGPGVDPHSYSASTGDVKAMESADLIIFNGFHLEAQLHDLLHHTFADRAFEMAAAFPKTSRIDWLEDGEVDPDAPFDPHIWNDLEGWAVCVEALGERLAKADPSHAESYRAQSKTYAGKVREAHTWAKELLAEIPEDRRFLVSGHDAFNYFARAYGLETVAVLGVGNDQEADYQTRSSVAKIIAERKVPVIFMESLTNPKITKALKESSRGYGWEVEIATETLYSDDLGETAPQNTYLGAFKSNVELIHKALK